MRVVLVGKADLLTDFAGGDTALDQCFGRNLVVKGGVGGCIHIRCCGNGAGHFWQTPGMPAQPKLTKRSLPHHSVPRLGSTAATGGVALLFCGSWLACDADTSVDQVHPVDAIAGKPAPTFDRARFSF